MQAQHPNPDGGTLVRARVLTGPTTAVHIAAVVSLLLGIGSAAWSAVVLPG